MKKLTEYQYFLQLQKKIKSMPMYMHEIVTYQKLQKKYSK